MRFIYSLAFLLLLPFIYLRLYWRSFKNPAYRQGFKERLAIFKKPERQGGLWIHAVSVGETIAAIPLIKSFQKAFPDLPITMTSMTPTGKERVQATFGNSVLSLFVPYDLPLFVRRFCRNIQPDLLVIMETELWPNLLFVAKQQKIPILLANARLSARSAKRYGYVRKFIKPMLQQIDKIAVQTEVEAQRFQQLGANPEMIFVTGSIKFDMPLPDDLIIKAEALRNSLGKERFIWVAASTHPGEEEIVLQAHREILQTYPNTILILVPRHQERFASVFSLCQKMQFSVVKRTERSNMTENENVFLGDTMGELLLFYASADVAFVGGSLVPVGGHNLLEPALLAKPIVTGWHMENFVAITDLLLSANGVVQIHKKEELAGNVMQFVNPEIANQYGQHALSVVEKNKGALEKHLQLIRELLKKNSR